MVLPANLACGVRLVRQYAGYPKISPTRTTFVSSKRSKCEWPKILEKTSYPCLSVWRAVTMTHIAPHSVMGPFSADGNQNCGRDAADVGLSKSTLIHESGLEKSSHCPC